MRTTLVAFLSICVSAAAFGQTATDTTATTATTVTAATATTTTAAPSTSKTTTAKEIDRNEPPDAPPTFDMHDNTPASMSYVHSYNRDNWKLAGLDDKISIHVNNFSTLVAKANNDCAQIVLFLDGMPIKGLKPESCDRIAGHIRYRLLRTPDADNAWHSLLGSPQGFTRYVNVTVGPDTQNTIGNPMEFELQILPRKQFWVFVLLLAVMLAVFVRRAQEAVANVSGDAVARFRLQALDRHAVEEEDDLRTIVVRFRHERTEVIHVDRDLVVEARQLPVVAVVTVDVRHRSGCAVVHVERRRRVGRFVAVDFFRRRRLRRGRRGRRRCRRSRHRRCRRVRRGLSEGRSRNANREESHESRAHVVTSI